MGSILLDAQPRREIAARQSTWAKWLASSLARAGVRPNDVSVMSVLWAFGAMAALALTPGAGAITRALLFAAAAAAIQLRLLCNLIDGMIAVEEGMKTPTGHLFNEIPDRIGDALIFAGAGLSARGLAAGAALGSAAAVLAVFTAYIRVLGGSLGVTQHFTGPMAKQHRMFVLTIAALASAVAPFAEWSAQTMRLALGVVVAGSVVTAWRRVGLIARELEAR